MPSEALKGVKPHDLGQILASPLCAQFLGDPGPEVSKVERSGSGDDRRSYGPSFRRVDQGYERDLVGSLLSCNRKKRGITVCHSKPKGTVLLRGLVAEGLAAPEAAGVPASPANDVAMAFGNPQVKFREMLTHTNHPVGGGVPVLRNPIPMSATPIGEATAPPMPGQDNDAALPDVLAYDETRIAGLRKAEVMQRAAVGPPGRRHRHEICGHRSEGVVPE